MAHPEKKWEGWQAGIFLPLTPNWSRSYPPLPQIEIHEHPLMGAGKEGGVYKLNYFYAFLSPPHQTEIYQHRRPTLIQIQPPFSQIEYWPAYLLPQIKYVRSLPLNWIISASPPLFLNRVPACDTRTSFWEEPLARTRISTDSHNSTDLEPLN